MFQNIKSDIIYYNTPADFEMEFNLCGCCRMRLLNDKCNDKKSLLTSLSRAVSRSRVIIITAPLFDSENIIGTIASSIGNGTEIIDNNSYGINSQAEINIIKGSTPLVTDDGLFGGCIIECGPQTMIILTENKSVRKNIMKTLIHPYISDLFALETSPEQPTEETDQNEIATESVLEEDSSEEVNETEELLIEEVVEQDTLKNDEIASEEENQNFILKSEPETEKPEYYEEEYQELYTETQIKPETVSDDDGYYYEEEYYIEESKSLPDSSFNTLILIISIIVLFALAVLCFCIFYVPTKAPVEPSVYLKDVFVTLFK